MTAATEDLFKKLSEFPEDVVAIILSFLPKCMLPYLLNFLPIRRAVAACILSDVKICYFVSRHSKNYHSPDSCGECAIGPISIKLSNLKTGIRQWKIYPKSIHLTSLNTLKSIKDTYPLLIAKAQFINGTFDFQEPADHKILVDSGAEFECLTLNNFDDYLIENPETLPSSIKYLELIGTNVKSFKIEGLRSLHVHGSRPLSLALIATLPDDLKALECQIHTHSEFTLPSGLRSLSINGYNNHPGFKLGKLEQLTSLDILSGHMTKIDELGLIANNLQNLLLTRCVNLIDYQGLRSFNNLRIFAILDGYYPVKLFNGTNFPNMTNFMYTGHTAQFPGSQRRDFRQKGEYLAQMSNLALTLPPNLEILVLNDAGDMTINFAESKLPKSLKALNLFNVSFGDESIQFPPSLENIGIECKTLQLGKDFLIPEQALSFAIKAKRITIRSFDFLYVLPLKLEKIILNASKRAEIPKLTKKITWPDSMKLLELRRFDITLEMLEKLNLSNSKISNVDFYRGKLGKLDLSLFPVNIDRLFLERMGITELPASFETLKNLQHLSLKRNYFGRVKSIRIPKLHCLNLNHCDLRFLSPFIESMVCNTNDKFVASDS